MLRFEIIADIQEENIGTKMVYTQMLKQAQVKILTGHALQSIENGIAVVKASDGCVAKLEADNVVMAVGLLPDLSVRDEMDTVPGLKVYYAGDCEKPRLIFDAIHAGFTVAMQV